MTCAVQPKGSAAAPADLVQRYSDAPDGVRVNMILSLDGASTFAGLAGPLSNICDRNLLLGLRGYADVVLVGAGTARAEGYGPVRLTPSQRTERRERWGITDIPPIAVVTRTGQLPEPLFAEPAQRPLLVTTAELARTRPDLRQRADLLLAGETDVDLRAAVERLNARGFHRILCEGGPVLLDQLIGADLVDEMCLTVSPTLAGEKSAVRHGAALRAPSRLALRHSFTEGDYVYLRYCRA
ncbi:pyrimidine reductase family protein [Mycolicibacterium sp.]|jgi:riboflavin biosynthesis pyrimidine reductase|uniref:pyrimidine reductase family protein n=1 Tax=Mycolicibacterium sp. TaxID=2320850 RepID=UPI0028B1F065|nr:pyrimidine reductase family protein [Mycolicibacterium sp.]